MTKVFIKDENVNLNFPDSMSQDEIRSVLRTRLAKHIAPPRSVMRGNAVNAGQLAANAEDELNAPGFIESKSISAPSEVSLQDFIPQMPKAPENISEMLQAGMERSPFGYGTEALGRGTSALNQLVLGDPAATGRALAGKQDASIGPAETIERVAGTYDARGEAQPGKDLLASFVNLADVLAGLGIGKGISAIGRAAKFGGLESSLAQGLGNKIINQRAGIAPIAEEAATKAIQRHATKTAIAEQRAGMLDELGFRKQQLSDLLRKRQGQADEAESLLMTIDEIDKKAAPMLEGQGRFGGGPTNELKQLVDQRQKAVASLEAIQAQAKGSVGTGTVKAGKLGVTQGGALPEPGIGEEISLTQQRIKDLQRNSKMLGKVKPEELPTPATAHYEFDPVSFTTKRTTPVQILGETIPETEVQMINREVGTEISKLVRKDSSPSMIDQASNLMRNAMYKVAPILMRVTNRLQTMGEGGKYLSVAEHAAENARRSIAGNAINEYRTDIASKLSDEDFNSMAQVISGFKQTTELSPATLNNISPLIQKMKGLTDNIGSMLQESGATTKTIGGDIQDFALVRSYFPSTMTPEGRMANSMKIFDAGSGEEALKYMRESGIPEDKAQSLLRFLESKRNPPSAARLSRIGAEKRGGFQHQRVLTPEDYATLGLEPPRFDKAVMEEYLMSASKKIADNTVYGNKQQKLTDSLSKIRLQFGVDSRQAKEAEQFIKDITLPTETSHYDKPYNLLRQMNVFHLGVPTNMIQLQQLATSGAVGTNRGFMRALAQGFTQDGKQLATRLGVDLSNDSYTLQKLYGIDATQTSQMKKWGDLYLQGLGLKRLDGLARKTAGLTGVESVQDFFKILQQNPKNLKARRFFEDFGFGFNVDDALQRGSLTEREIHNAARYFDKQINFWGLISDVPAVMNTKVGRLIFQYKPQAFMQTMMIKDVLIKEAMRGNPAPLAKYLLAAAITGEAYGSLEDAMSARNPFDNEYRPSWESPEARIASNIIEQGGGMGILSDLISSAKFAKSPQDFVTDQLGPSFSSVMSLGTGLGQLNEGDLQKGVSSLLKIPTPVTPAFFTTPLRGLLRED